MIASGSDVATASPIPTASRPSTMIAFAPISRIAAAERSLVAVPVTSWPRATSIGTSRRPTAPFAPATKTPMVGPPFSPLHPRGDGEALRETLQSLQMVSPRDSVDGPRTSRAAPPAALRREALPAGDPVRRPGQQLTFAPDGQVVQAALVRARVLGDDRSAIGREDPGQVVVAG